MANEKNITAVVNEIAYTPIEKASEVQESEVFEKSLAERLNVTAREVSPAEPESPMTPTEKKAALRADAETLIQLYNDAYQTAKFDEAHKLGLKIDEKINEYTSIARDECFAELLASDDPMLEAVKRLSYQTIRTKTRKEGDEKIPVMFIEDSEKSINLLRLHKAAKDGIGKDEKWYAMIEKLNFLLTAKKAEDLGIDPRTVNDSYAMSKIARELDMGATPTSNTNLLNTVQMIVTAMIGEEYKATSHDVKFLNSIYSRKSRKALTVTCANHKFLTGYMAEICNHIVTKEPYKIEFRTIKQ